MQDSVASELSTSTISTESLSTSPVLPSSTSAATSVISTYTSHSHSSVVGEIVGGVIGGVVGGFALLIALSKWFIASRRKRAQERLNHLTHPGALRHDMIDIRQVIPPTVRVTKSSPREIALPPIPRTTSSTPESRSPPALQSTLNPPLLTEGVGG